MTSTLNLALHAVHNNGEISIWGVSLSFTMPQDHNTCASGEHFKIIKFLKQVWSIAYVYVQHYILKLQYSAYLTVRIFPKNIFNKAVAKTLDILILVWWKYHHYETYIKSSHGFRNIEPAKLHTCMAVRVTKFNTYSFQNIFISVKFFLDSQVLCHSTTVKYLFSQNLLNHVYF
jgi:hypothetical protein